MCAIFLKKFNCKMMTVKKYQYFWGNKVWPNFIDFCLGWAETWKFWSVQYSSMLHKNLFILIFTLLKNLILKQNIFHFINTTSWPALTFFINTILLPLKKIIIFKFTLCNAFIYLYDTFCLMRTIHLKDIW